MGVEAYAAIAAAGSLLSAASNTYQAVKTSNAMEKQQEQYEDQLKKANQEEANQKKKQQDLQNNYRNMKANLYSGDINGIASNQLIQ